MRKVAAGVLIGLAAIVVVLGLSAAGVLDRPEMWLYDWRLRWSAQPDSVSKDIVLVEIDDGSIQTLEPVVGRWPWPRALHGLLVDYLQRGRPKVIVIDIGFWEKERESRYAFLGEDITGEQSDQRLADAARRAGNVIALADAAYQGQFRVDDAGKPIIPSWPSLPYRLSPEVQERPIIQPPYDALGQSAARLGHNFLALDDDGLVRRIAPFIRQGDRYLPSLGMAAALFALDVKPEDVALEEGVLRVRDRRIPIVGTPETIDGVVRTFPTVMVNYLAPPKVKGKRPYTTFSASDLLRSEGQILEGSRPDIDPAQLANKIVFVGTSAAGLFDVFQTPFGEGEMPGIQLHATIADSVLANRFIRRAPDVSRVLGVVVSAVAIGLTAAFLSFNVGAMITLAIAVGWTWIAVAAFRDGLWLNLFQPVLGMAIALFGGTTYRYFIEDREKRKVKKLFGRYVSKDVYNQLLEHPDRAELGGKRREMSVLFSDIRGFTTVTEKGNPEDLVSQLNEYFSKMVEVVFRHQGTVDKFVGDMVMALFGAPLDDANHAEHAVTAAVDMVRELGELNRKWSAEGRATLDIGVGINSGDMIAGNIGSSSIMSYTVIGDNVNLGSRLESLNKDYKTRIIISEATRGRLRGDYDIRPLGAVVVKGKSKPVDIFEIRVPSPLPEAPEEAKL